MITKHLGHESVGTVVSVLPGSNYKVGDRVNIFQGDHCGQCHACRHALSPTYCQSNNPDIHGVEKSAMKGIENLNESDSGGFAMAKYRIAPKPNLYRIPDAVDFRYAAACNYSLGAGFSNQELMNVKAGDSVLVGGVGFISIGHIISTLYRNARVIVLIRNPYRRKLLEKIGVEHFINPDDESWLEQVMELTYEGQGADHAVDGSGVSYYQEKLMQATRIYGTVNFSGYTPGARISLSPLHHIIDPSHRLVGQHDVRAQDREYLVRSLLDKDVQRRIDVMATHEFPMSQAGEAFDIQVTKQCGKIHLLVNA